MPRNVAIVKTSVWEAGSDFRTLSENAQWTYLMLISQRQINTCGVLSYTPERWQHLSSDGKRAKVTRGLAELAAKRYVITDETTGELLVRTFVRHDQVWKKPKLVIAARSQFKEILSDQIRSSLAAMHPWIADEAIPVTEGVSEPVSEPVPEPVNGHVGDTPPYARADTQAQPPASRLPSPTTKAEDLSLSADRSETTSNGLPIEQEQLAAQLLQAIGSDADERTPDQIRIFTTRLPASSFAKVLESVRTQRPDNRAAYAVGALKSEFAELASRT